MIPNRKEINEYTRACESLIFAAASPGATRFTLEDFEWIVYYSKEMTSLVDKLAPDHKPEGRHERQTVREYARSSEALLGVKNLTNAEQESIRGSLSDVQHNILDADQNQ